MSLHPQPVPPVPEETARVARAAFPHGNLYLVMRDALGALFTDEDFATLFPRRGQPAEAPWRLALILVLQYVEDLSDRQAADAVRSRIDWKYALSLELADPGFDSTVLSEFRTRLVTGAAEQRILDAILTKCREQAWLQARGRQRTDSTHVLAHVRAVNRLECVRETLRHALNRLATVAPAWLQAHCLPAWGERYGRRLDATRLSTSTEDRSAYAQEIGADGSPSCQHCMPLTPPSGYGKSLLSRRYDGCGSSNFIVRMVAYVGVPSTKGFPRRGSLSVRPMTLRRGMPRSIRRHGSATKSM